MCDQLTLPWLDQDGEAFLDSLESERRGRWSRDPELNAAIQDYVERGGKITRLDPMVAVRNESVGCFRRSWGRFEGFQVDEEGVA